jgi:hypothetical protein
METPEAPSEAITPSRRESGGSARSRLSAAVRAMSAFSPRTSVRASLSDKTISGQGQQTAQPKARGSLKEHTRKHYVAESARTRVNVSDVVALMQMDAERVLGVRLLLGYLVYCFMFFLICFWVYDLPQFAGQCPQAVRTAYIGTDFVPSPSARHTLELADVKTRGEVLTWLLGVWVPETYPPVESRDDIANETARRIYLRSKSVCYL